MPKNTLAERNNNLANYWIRSEKCGQQYHSANVSNHILSGTHRRSDDTNVLSDDLSILVCISRFYCHLQHGYSFLGSLSFSLLPMAVGIDYESCCTTYLIWYLISYKRLVRSRCYSFLSRLSRFQTVHSTFFRRGPGQQSSVIWYIAHCAKRCTP